MEREGANPASVRALQGITGDTGPPNKNKNDVVRRRIEKVHRHAVSHDTEPAGAPLLGRGDD